MTCVDLQEAFTLAKEMKKQNLTPRSCCRLHQISSPRTRIEDPSFPQTLSFGDTANAEIRTCSVGRIDVDVGELTAVG
jgi:hypothetical protein